MEEIDSDGKPTEFESKDMTGGGVSEEELKQAVGTALMTDTLLESEGE